ncbi:hypothetical protein BEN47_02940 [Hymenobacter lapidarius]|uniref:Uncharacterized protein n=1 Tax=Hymenobacter lapidarius TaxID=1908237 RepID=A0A1G1T0H9_9BACT|nr:hypothetical protein BEN47_02940 [Hymenobacter lapidarius]
MCAAGRRPARRVAGQWTGLAAAIHRPQPAGAPGARRQGRAERIGCVQAQGGAADTVLLCSVEGAQEFRFGGEVGAGSAGGGQRAEAQLAHGRSAVRARKPVAAGPAFGAGEAVAWHEMGGGASIVGAGCPASSRSSQRTLSSEVAAAGAWLSTASATRPALGRSARSWLQEVAQSRAKAAARRRKEGSSMALREGEVLPFHVTALV